MAFGFRMFLEAVSAVGKSYTKYYLKLNSDSESERVLERVWVWGLRELIVKSRPVVLHGATLDCMRSIYSLWSYSYRFTEFTGSHSSWVDGGIGIGNWKWLSIYLWTWTIRLSDPYIGLGPIGGHNVSVVGRWMFPDGWFMVGPNSTLPASHQLALRRGDLSFDLPASQSCCRRISKCPHNRGESLPTVLPGSGWLGVMGAWAKARARPFWL